MASCSWHAAAKSTLLKVTWRGTAMNTAPLSHEGCCAAPIKQDTSCIPLGGNMVPDWAHSASSTSTITTHPWCPTIRGLDDLDCGRRHCIGYVFCSPRSKKARTHLILTALPREAYRAAASKMVTIAVNLC